jgi:hypothetical protein
MRENLTWLQKEINKDKEEVAFAKKKTIKEILKIPKEEITKGPLKTEKNNLWKKMCKKIKDLYQR